MIIDPGINIDSKIWRYVNFPKYVDMMLRKSLFFSRLTNFNDPYEGRLTDYDVKIEENGIERLKSLWGEDWKIITGDATPERKESLEKIRKESIVNCWHRNEYESAMLWKLYSNDQHGVIIQSTIKKLDESFKESNYVTIMGVRYLDYEKEGIGREFVFNGQLFIKRKSFAHEQEIRAAMPSNLYSNGKPVINLSPEEKGRYVDVDLNILIEKIYVDPLSEGWFADIVKLITKMYLPEKEVEQSKLYSLK